MFEIIVKKVTLTFSSQMDRHSYLLVMDTLYLETGSSTR